MNIALIKELMEIYTVLTFTAQEIQWIYARGYTNIDAIVKDACATTDQLKTVLMKESTNNKDYQDTIIKIVIIGRYFFHQVFPNYEHQELNIDVSEFPIDDAEMTEFTKRFFNANTLQTYARTIMAKYAMK